MRRLTKEQREALAAQIGQRAGVLRAEVAAALRQPGDSDTIHLANHLAEIDDEAVADLETTLDVAALERDLAELRALDDAGARLPGKDYGACADCGEQIPFRRLQVNPAASRCTGCQAAHELKLGAVRPATI